MMAYCTKCEEDLPSDGSYITCLGCDSFLHSKCCSIATSTYKAMSKQRKTDWRCEFCRLANKIAKKLPDQGTTLDSRLDALFKQNLKEFHDKYVQLQKTVIQLQETIAQLINSNTEKESVINSLTIEIDKLDQRALANQLIIRGVSERAGDELDDVIMKIASKYDIELNKSDVVNIYRIKNKKVDKSQRSGQPPPIVVQFNSAYKRGLFTEKKGIHITESDILQKGGQNKVYINEVMTRNNLTLFWQAKDKAQATGWRYVWFANGQIKARKESGAKFIFIDSVADLGRIN